MPAHDATCWLVKSSRKDGDARTYVKEGICAVGAEWPGIGDLATTDDASVFLTLEGAGRRKPQDDLVQARIISDRMAVGDIVVTPDTSTGDLLFGEITGEYAYTPGSRAGGDVHQRPVEWFGRLTEDHLEPYMTKAVEWRGGRVRKLPEQVHWLRTCDQIRDGLGRPADDFPIATRTVRKARSSGSSGATRTSTPRKSVAAKVRQQICPSCGLLLAISMFPDGGEYCRDCD